MKKSPKKKSAQAAIPKTSLIVSKSAATKSGHESSFVEVVNLIQQTRQRTFQAVNAALVDLYWRWFRWGLRAT